MAKTQTPATVTLHSGEQFSTNAVPDLFDDRDLAYRPRLSLLPGEMDQRQEATRAFVLTQRGNSCTGHAVAAAVNIIRARQVASANGAKGSPPAVASTPRVSPYMVYAVARRYDEFEGEEDLGSSLRGALKGWFNHGVCREQSWPDLTSSRDLADPQFRNECGEIPLGAYYRVNAHRLDDMQSAVSELGVIVASAAVHDGWIQPAVITPPPGTGDGKPQHLIVEKPGAEQLGGHAFAIVGYNRIGFLVQNSWGATWGKGGYATLPYEDWLKNAYDAWVARPGVPHTPFVAGYSRTAGATGGGLTVASGPDLDRLRRHVVNLGNNGRFSRTGKITSDPDQLESIFAHMDACHAHWQNQQGGRRQIVLYAHGGLNSESAGIDVAEKQLNWWLNNRIFPVTFAWQSGAAETLVDQLEDLASRFLPFGGILGDLVEQWDRRCEKLARESLSWLWAEMKENAARASEAPGGGDPFSEPGATFVANRLKRYIDEHPGEVDVHLAGHSAGSIFHAYLLERLAALGIPVETVSFLAPAIRVDVFADTMLTRLGPGREGGRLAMFVLSDKRELDDDCAVYRKSLLYLVSRALESRPPGRFETPILGMQRFLGEQVTNLPLKDLLDRVQAQVVVSPANDPAKLMSNAGHHGGFADDEATMTSVARHILGAAPTPYSGRQELDAAVVPEAPVGAVGVRARGRAAAAAPRPAVRVEVAQAPRLANPLLDVLVDGEGWSVESS